MKIKYKTDKKFINSLKWLKTKKENCRFYYRNSSFSCHSKNSFYYQTHIVGLILDKFIKDLINEKNNK